MSRLSAPMKAAMRAGAELYAFQELGYPGGATRRYAAKTVSSASLGTIEGLVLKWGTWSCGSMDRSFSLEPIDLPLTIDDSSRYFAGLIEGVNGYSVEDASAVTKIAAVGVSPSDWLTLCTGIIEDFSWEGPTAYALRTRSDDRSLRRDFPKEIISLANWPNADQSARAKPVPLLYGKFDSGGAGGALPTLLVDLAGARYLVCAGHAKSVDRVYVDGLQVTSGFTITFPVVAGRVYTIVDFTASQADHTVTVDAQGYEAVGDGSGALIENEATQLKHALVNWEYGDYKTGAWLSDASAPVSVSHFTTAAAFLTARGHKGSRYIAGAKRRKGIDLVNEWCGSLQCRPYWTNLGQLAIRFEDHGITTIYLDDPWLQWQRHLGAFKLRYDTQQRMDRVTAAYLRNEVQGQYTQSLEVRDPRLTKEAPDSLELAWAYAVA